MSAPEYGIRWTPAWENAIAVVYPQESREALEHAMNAVRKVSIDMEHSKVGLGLYEPVVRRDGGEWWPYPAIDSSGEIG